MAKELNKDAEAAFKAEQMEAAYSTMIEARLIASMTPRQLEAGGYGEDQDSAIVTHIRTAIRIADRRAAAFLKSQG